jgi:hypothetical protein
VRFTQGKRTLPAAMFFFGLCVYAYAMANVFVPLFLIGFAVLYIPTLWRRLKEAFLAFVVLIATVAPAAVFLYTHPQSMFYVRNTSALNRDLPLSAQAARIGQNYLEFFSRSFLLQNGDAITRHAVHGFGELLPFYAPFVLLGAVVAAIRRDRPSKLVLWWLALYPLGPSLMTEIPSASRGIIGVAAFCLLAGLGMAAALRVLGWASHWRALALAVQAAALAGAAYVLVPEVVQYVRAYFVDYVKYSAPTYGGFQYGYRDSIHYMETQRANYDLLMITAVEVNQPQIFPLFYNRVDPREWKAHHNLGYLISDPAYYADYAMNQRILYQLRQQDLEFFNDYTIHQRIVAPGGQVEFVIAEVRTRKRYLTNWLVLGPYLNNNNEGVQQNFIDVQHPTKDRYKGAFGDIYWRPIAPRSVRVDLNGFYATSDPRHPGNPEEVCAYALATVRSTVAQSGFLELAGSNDYMQAWLNGQTLTPYALMLGLPPKRRPIELREGTNILMLKSCEAFGDWYFTARISDAEGHDLPNITVVAEIPTQPIVPPPSAASGHEHVQLVEGFGSVVSFKHTEHYPDYRGATQSWWSYVQDQQSEVVWRTASCPERKRTVLVLSASTSPETAEADLYVNGKYVLTFSFGGPTGATITTRGGYRLTFLPRSGAGGNSGVMLLDLPADQIVAGQPVEIRVAPTRGADHAWFMIKSYADTIGYEHLTPEQAVEAFHGTWETHSNADS